MFCGVGAGAADAHGRQRNIFPLPEIPGGDRAAPSGGEWQVFANQGIKAPNELAGVLNSEYHTKKKTTRAQRRALSHISDAYMSAFRDFPSDCSQGGLHELCSTSRLYDSGRSDVQPYVKERISWPEASSRPVSVLECVAEADREWLGAWRKHMLRSKADITNNSESVTPYIDPILVGEYAGFLQELDRRSMIGFQPAVGQPSMLGIFFVR